MLSAGSKLGSYEITAWIGAGGMGEVYRARDTRLGRDVALKILPEGFARDRERVARFQREARILASLNHPSIAAIYGLEDTESVPALVTEFIEGSTLADRLKVGPLPIHEAVLVGREIAEALEYAHDCGIVHRDLKPSNVKVTPDGTVKVLDFGLAKVTEANSLPEGMHATDLLRRMEKLLDGSDSEARDSSSPVLSELATRAGTLLGTAAYMSPEQAKGKSVDRRADIWAFGCVLYEMLSGEVAFGGDSMTETLAEVIKEDPDWSRLPSGTPASVRLLLHRCLQKDPKRRLQAIGEARIVLDDVLSGAVAPRTSPHLQPSTKKWWLVVAGVILLVGVANLIARDVWKRNPHDGAPGLVTRFTVDLPPGCKLWASPALALSRDGNQLAYVAESEKDGTRQIYLRTMDTGETRGIPGTEGGVEPFFSPDGEWLGFFSDGKLKKVSVRGGLAQNLADVVNPMGGSWSDQHVIAFASYGAGIQQVLDGGGTPQPLTSLETAAADHWWPEFLPSGKKAIFEEHPQIIAVQIVGGQERRILIQGPTGDMPRYMPSGYLVFARAGSLMAAPFDAEHLQVAGGAVPVLQDVSQSSADGAAQFAISAAGTLGYASGTPQLLQSTLVWVSRNGVEQSLGSPVRGYNQPRISPDGRRVALDVMESGDEIQVWLYDLAQRTLRRFTYEGVNRHPVWTPDGQRIAFISDRGGPSQIFWQMADGSGVPQQLTRGTAADVHPIPDSWLPDGQLLAFAKFSPTKGAEFWALHVADRKESPLLQIRTADDGAPQFSPDGHWLAYVSQESGRREIYVQAYPGPGGKQQVSTDGGNEPQWNRNGRELFYRNGDAMMVANISSQGGGLFASKPRQLFEGNYVTEGVGYARPSYDVSPDGRRFLMLKPVEQNGTGTTRINVVLNWTEELKRLVPRQNK